MTNLITSEGEGLTNLIEAEAQRFWAFRNELAAAIRSGDMEEALDALSEIELIAECSQNERLRAAAWREIENAKKLPLAPLCHPGEEGIAGFRMPSAWRLA
jgi:hypothetical protein